MWKIRPLFAPTPILKFRQNIWRYNAVFDSMNSFLLSEAEIRTLVVINSNYYKNVLVTMSHVRQLFECLALSKVLLRTVSWTWIYYWMSNQVVVLPQFALRVFENCVCSSASVISFVIPAVRRRHCLTIIYLPKTYLTGKDWKEINHICENGCIRHLTSLFSASTIQPQTLGKWTYNWTAT